MLVCMKNFGFPIKLHKSGFSGKCQRAKSGWYWHVASQCCYMLGIEILMLSRIVFGNES